jgi:cytochrome bd-type quinol oxidase subunit 2
VPKRLPRTQRAASHLVTLALIVVAFIVFIGVPSAIAVLLISHTAEWLLPGALVTFLVAAGLTVMGGRAVATRPAPSTARVALAVAVVVWCALMAGALLGWVLATHLPSGPDRLSSPAAWLGPVVAIAPLLCVWAIWEPYRRVWQRRDERSAGAPHDDPERGKRRKARPESARDEEH